VFYPNICYLLNQGLVYSCFKF